MMGGEEGAVLAVPEQIRCGALPDPSGLLAAIISHPDEDDPRLRYADYLDEQDSAPFPCARCRGKGKIKEFGPYGYDRWFDNCPVCEGAGTHPSRGSSLRAELIRVQCEMAHIERSHDAIEWERCNRSLFELPEWYKDWGTLDARRSELMLSVKSALSPTGLHDSSWHRGFIARVCCTWEEWAKHGDELRKREWVPRVRLTTLPRCRWERDENPDNLVLLPDARAQLPVLVVTRGEYDTHGASRLVANLMTGVYAERFPGTAFEVAEVNA